MTPKKTLKKPGLDDQWSEHLMGKAGFLLNKAVQKVRVFYEESLRPYKITGKYLTILWVIREKGRITQNDIGKCVNVDRTTMVQIIDDLEKLGLVERKDQPADRRSHAIYLTAKGKAALPKADHLAHAAERKFLSHLETREQQELIRLLRKLVSGHYSQAQKKDGEKET